MCRRPERRGGGFPSARARTSGMAREVLPGEGAGAARRGPDGIVPLLLRLWRSPKVRGIFWQALVLGLVVALFGFLIHNTLVNLEQRNIRTGYGFLWREAGFFIGESPIPYDASDTYARAFLVGVLNTLQVAVIGIVLATVTGALIGIARLSSNWLVARLSSGYVEVTRNVPLLLQLFFWYTIIAVALPDVRQALEPIPGVVLSKSGLQLPVPIRDPRHLPIILVFLASIAGCVFWYRRAKARQAATGEEPRLLLPILAILILPSLALFLALGAPLELDMPTWHTFNYRGGASVTPEFLALLLGLSLYTAGFIAEIVRSGILGVSWGQTEAAAALGLRKGLQLRLVVLPQALRIIIPPTTSQYLNLTKNSSLAVAIGYPDLVSIANTSLNQTGQAIECISIMMAVYLSISLGISAFMNWYNRRIALVER
jgi:general L-amino acid transport system permease protein